MTDFGALLAALGDCKVEYIVVDGAAAIAHGSARLTQDLDIVYRRTPGNLDRLVAALAAHKPQTQTRDAEHAQFDCAAVQILPRSASGNLTQQVDIAEGRDQGKIQAPLQHLPIPDERQSGGPPRK
jgi:hypothetical protein